MLAKISMKGFDHISNVKRIMGNELLRKSEFLQSISLGNVITEVFQIHLEYILSINHHLK